MNILLESNHEPKSSRNTGLEGRMRNKPIKYVIAFGNISVTEDFKTSKQYYLKVDDGYQTHFYPITRIVVQLKSKQPAFTSQSTFKDSDGETSATFENANEQDVIFRNDCGDPKQFIGNDNEQATDEFENADLSNASVPEGDHLVTIDALKCPNVETCIQPDLFQDINDHQQMETKIFQSNNVSYEVISKISESQQSENNSRNIRQQHAVSAINDTSDQPFEDLVIQPELVTDPLSAVDDNENSTIRIVSDGQVNSIDPFSEYGEMPQSNTSRGKGRKHLPATAVNILKKWLYTHRYKAYPTEEQKHELALQTKLSILQISNWFINARRRILPGMISQEGYNPELFTISRQNKRNHFLPTPSSPETNVIANIASGEVTNTKMPTSKPLVRTINILRKRSATATSQIIDSSRNSSDPEPAAKTLILDQFVRPIPSQPSIDFTFHTPPSEVAAETTYRSPTSQVKNRASNHTLPFQNNDKSAVQKAPTKLDDIIKAVTQQPNQNIDSRKVIVRPAYDFLGGVPKSNPMPGCFIIKSPKLSKYESPYSDF